MFSKNWSFSNELKSKEKKRQEKIQKRQKHDFMVQKLENVDIPKLYYKIQRLEETEKPSIKEIKYLKKLKEDWSFIEKNDLHKEKFQNLISTINETKRKKEENKKRLYGKESIYFNPELNPLGKVPQQENLSIKLLHELPNFKIPLNHEYYFEYEKDESIDELNVVFPEGDPPKYYKIVLNTDRIDDNKSDKINKTIIEVKENLSILIPTSVLKKQKQK